MKHILISWVTCMVGSVTFPDADLIIKVFVPAVVGLISKIIDIMQTRWERKQEHLRILEREEIQKGIKTIHPQEREENHA